MIRRSVLTGAVVEGWLKARAAALKNAGMDAIFE
jgi:hypothetical protein